MVIVIGLVLITSIPAPVTFEVKGFTLCVIEFFQCYNIKHTTAISRVKATYFVLFKKCSGIYVPHWALCLVYSVHTFHGKNDSTVVPYSLNPEGPLGSHLFDIVPPALFIKCQFLFFWRESKQDFFSR